MALKHERAPMSKRLIFNCAHVSFLLHPYAMGLSTSYEQTHCSLLDEYKGLCRWYCHWVLGVRGPGWYARPSSVVAL
jgi:hypothetical protein